MVPHLSAIATGYVKFVEKGGGRDRARERGSMGVVKRNSNTSILLIGTVAQTAKSRVKISHEYPKALKIDRN